MLDSNKPSKWWITILDIWNYICVLRWRNEHKRSSQLWTRFSFFPDRLNSLLSLRTPEVSLELVPPAWVLCSLAHQILTSVSIFSILFSTHVKRSRASLVGIHLLYSCVVLSYSYSLFWMCDSGVMLWGEIRCWSRVKDLLTRYNKTSRVLALGNKEADTPDT